MYVDSMDSAREYAYAWESAVRRGEVSVKRAAWYLTNCALTCPRLPEAAREYLLVSAQSL